MNIIGVVESYFLVDVTMRAAVFCTRCNVQTKYFGIPCRSELQDLTVVNLRTNISMNENLSRVLGEM